MELNTLLTDIINATEALKARTDEQAQQGHDRYNIDLIMQLEELSAKLTDANFLAQSIRSEWI